MTKKRKRQLNIEDEDETQESKRASTVRDLPFVTIDTLPLNFESQYAKFERIADETILDMNLRSNREQLEAFQTVAQHLANRGPEQLLLLVSGVGGTGKSHVIKSI
ncbi:hypothetical protein CVT26_006836, partial [Gymnopilus dilepis]